MDYIVSLDYIFQCATFIEAMAFSAHSKKKKKASTKFKQLVQLNAKSEGVIILKHV